MKFTEAEVRSLSAASDRRGWVQIPESIPPHFLQIVLEGRHKTLNATRSVAKPRVVAVDPVASLSEREAMQRKLRIASIALLQ
jgi:hypothetical protein